jgi:hypothetical protein
MESLKKADIQDFNLLKKIQNLEDRFEIISNTFQDKVSVNDVKTVCDELIKDKFTEFEAKNDIKSQVSELYLIYFQDIYNIIYPTSLIVQLTKKLIK